jgi:Flp pilus assembly protein TadD
MVEGASGRMADAEKAFREAVSRDGKDAEYAYNLGLALARQGKKEEAASLFRRSLEIRPDFRAPRERLREMRAVEAH